MGKGRGLREHIQTDRIARIDPATGKVVGWIDLTGILRPADRTGETDVLNGIAYDAARRPAVRHGKTLAQAVRDSADAEIKRAVGV